MSSWVHDWERALIPRVNGTKAKARTQCKLGGHLVLEGVAMVWLRGPGLPLGLSCTPCAELVAPALVQAELAKAAPLVQPPAKNRGGRPPEGLKHGTTAGYNKHKCRCDPCKEANVEAGRLYRQRRRERLAALEGAAA